jgi:hypothetical protein
VNTMSLRVALDFADNPRLHPTLQAPADTMDELYRALTVLAAEVRRLQTEGDAPKADSRKCQRCGEFFASAHIYRLDGYPKFCECSAQKTEGNSDV